MHAYAVTIPCCALHSPSCTSANESKPSAVDRGLVASHVSLQVAHSLRSDELEGEFPRDLLQTSRVSSSPPSPLLAERASDSPLSLLLLTPHTLTPQHTHTLQNGSHPRSQSFRQRVPFPAQE